MIVNRRQVLQGALAAGAAALVPGAVGVAGGGKSHIIKTGLMRPNFGAGQVITMIGFQVPNGLYRVLAVFSGYIEVAPENFRRGEHEFLLGLAA